MRFPKTFGAIDMHKTEELIMRSIELGVNYFDTAWVYSGSEEAVGAVLDKNRVRDKIYIATKLPLIMVKKPEDFDKFFDQSLQRLKTDHIDYYLLHMITDTEQLRTLKKWGIEEWIARKKKTGQIRQIGFFFFFSGSEFLGILNDYDWEFCQIQYNYSDENFQAGVTGLRAAAQKMPVVIMEPLLGGKLATGLPKDAIKIFHNADANLTPVGWALNWLWNQEEVTTVLSGMSAMNQLEENVRLADAAKVGMLGDTGKSVYANVLEYVKRSCKIQCTGCNYCMPCPAGVNIPGCFSAYNTMYSLGFVSGMQQFITSTGFTSEKGSSPSMCIKCGKCETHCPQKLSIMKELVNVKKKMEPWLIRFIGVCARAFLGKSRKK
jgi:predicted aldo/keto reductase-like oxidoreductase